MKLNTILGLISSGQLSLLARLNSIFRQSYRASFVTAALSEGLYDLLRNGPASLDQIYQRLVGSLPAADGSLEKLKAWLDMGVYLGELKLTPAGYTLRSRLSRQLAQPAQDAIAAMYQEVNTLHHDLLTQTPARLRENHLYSFADLNGELIARSSRILEPYISEVVDSVVPAQGAFTLFEVGCGSAIYIRRACLRNPELHALGLELIPAVAASARQNLQTWGLSARVQVETGDIRDYSSPDCFDLVTLHNNIYYFPIPERLDLVRRLAKFLNPGGTLLLTTACHGFASSQALNLWAEMTADAGPLPRVEDVSELFVQSGFTAPRVIPLLPTGGFYAFIASLP